MSYLMASNDKVPNYLNQFTANCSRVGVSFLNTGGILDKAQFYLNSYGTPGTPTGNMYAQIFAHTGTFGTTTSKGVDPALATSDPVDVSTLTGSSTLTTFTFSGVNKINLVNTHYVLVMYYTDGTAFVNTVQYGHKTGNPYGGRNTYRKNSTGWTGSTDTADICFFLYVDEQIAKGSQEAPKIENAL